MKIAVKLADVTPDLMRLMSDLSGDPKIFDALLSGAMATADIIAFLRQLSARGETSDDLVALVLALRAHALPFPPMPEALPKAMDVCGTGGDGLNTPNISTAVALVLAGCGMPVVKHGNRAASSACGSADVLEALGVNIEAGAEIAARALRETHICFLFARHYHPAMRHVAEARKMLGTRTIFNLAGPLANPARPGRQLLGVYDRAWLRPMAEALHRLGSRSAWVVHSRDGMDEISTMTPSDIVCMKDGALTEMTLDPAGYGLQCDDPAALRGGDAARNASMLRGLLAGETGALQDIVCLNAAAALVVADRAATIAEGLALTRRALQNGAARNALEKLAAITQGKA